MRAKTAKFSPYRFETVIPLYELLPLALPLSIHIDPANICNFRCKFCPTGSRELLRTVGRPSGLMSYDLYCKIIDDLYQLTITQNRMVKRLFLYKDGEPLFNSRLGDMAEYAKKRQVAESVETTINASLLSKKNAISLIEKGFDVIRVSIEHVTCEGYQEITRTFSDYDKIVKAVKFLYEEKARRNSPLCIHTKIVNTGLTKYERKKFVSDFGNISDTINIDELMGWSRAESKDFTLGIRVTSGMDGVSPLCNRIVCPEPFSKLAINFDGSVSVCCVDWSHGTIVGDLRKKSLSDVWNGESLHRFRMAHLYNQREKIRACASCHYLCGLPEHCNIDSRVDSLVKMYSRNGT